MDSEMWRTAAILLIGAVVMATAATQGNITQFVANNISASSLQVNAGSQVVFTCQVSYSVNATRSPIVYLKKTFNQYPSQDVATDDALAEGVPDNLYMGVVVDTPKGFDIYQITINSAVAADTGNYTCSTGSAPLVSSKTISLNVSVDPSVVMLYIDNETVSQFGYTKTMLLGQTYRLRCVASGGNPFPNVTLTNGSTVIPATSTSYATVKTIDTFPGTINRSTEVIANWVMSQQSIGSTVSCRAAANATGTSAGISVSFTPTADNAPPQFQCLQDVVTYDGKAPSLAISCNVIGSNLTSLYVQWQNSSSSASVYFYAPFNQLNVGKQSFNDTRYALQITQFQVTLGYTMTLTISAPATVGELTTTKYNFGADSSRGRAIHTVNVNTASPIGPVGFGTRSATPAVGYLVALLLSVVAFIRP